ncbi:MAG: beta strand repeat-containing protein, partial [Gemmataceae bacterium]
LDTAQPDAGHREGRGAREIVDIVGEHIPGGIAAGGGVCGATNDTGSATEAGGTANATAGSDATGTVLSNDVNDFSGTSSLTVTSVRLGSVEGSGTAGTVGSTLVGTYGTLTLSSDGSFTYQVDQNNATVQALVSGATLTESINYTTGNGTYSDTAVLAITITGANDAPDLLSIARLSGALQNTPFTITYAALATAADEADAESDPISFRIESVTTGTLEKFDGSNWVAVSPGTTLLSTGESLRWTPASQARGDLNAFTVTAWDGSLSSGTPVQVRVNVRGVGATNDTGSATEAGGTANATAGSDATGNVLSNDVNDFSGTSSLTVTSVRLGGVEGSGTAGTLGVALLGIYGTLTLNSDGSFTYQVDQNNATVQALAPGVTLTESFNYTTDNGTYSDTAVLAITITGANDAPTLTNISVNGTEDTTLAFTASNFTSAYTDPESTALSSIQILGLPATGTLKLDGADVTVNQIIAVADLAKLTYVPVANAYGAKTFTIAGKDGDLASNTVTVTINLDPVNDAPVVTPTGSLSYTEAASATAIQSGITLSDVDDTQVTGATISIASPVAGDSLSFTNTGTITGSFSGGVLTLSGTDTLANYQAALRAVEFSSTSTDPTVNGTRLTRTVTFNVTDANASNAANGQQTGSASATINITGTNSAPVLADSALSISVPEDGGVPSGAVGALVSSLLGGITDADTYAALGLAITATVETNGTCYYSTNGGTTWTTVGSVSSSNSLLLAADANTRLYFNSTAANYSGTRTAVLTFKAWDGTSGTVGTKVNPGTFTATGAFSSATDTVDVVVTPVNDAPVVTAGFSSSYFENSPADSSNSYSLNFSGSSYVPVPSNTSYPTGNSQYTLEAWIKPTTHGVNGIVGWGTWGSTNQTNALRLNSNGQIVNYWWNNDLYATPGNLADGNWHHVAATFDGTYRRIYVDGVLLASDTPTGHNVPSTASNVRIGTTNNTEYFSGGIDDVRVWNRARTASEIANTRLTQVDGATSGLVAYYRFNEGSGTVAANSATATSGINGTLVNNPTWSTAIPALSGGISPGLTLADVDDTALASGATVAITSGFTSGDQLGIPANSLLAGVTASYDATTGVLTFTGSTTVANYQAMFRAVAYSSTSDWPTQISTSRTVTYTVTDLNASVASNGAQSGSGTSTVTITEVNDVPTLTAFSGPVGTTAEDVEVEVSLADLLAAGNEADIDGTVTAFVVKAVSTGTLKIGTSSAAATVWNASTNATIDSSKKAYWTPAANYSGTLNAFTAVAKDNGGSESASAVQVTVTVTPVNDAPVLSGSNPVLAAINEDTASGSITGQTISSLVGSLFSDAADAVGGGTANTFAGIAITAYSENTAKGVWQYSSDSGTSWNTIATVSSASLALTLLPADKLRFVPAADFNGTTPALTFAAIESPTTVTSGALVDASSRGGSTPFSSATLAISQSITAVADSVADSLSATEDGSVTANLLTGTNGASADNFEDAARAITAVTQGAHGAVTFNADGTVTYTPTANWTGTDSFSYTVTSGTVTESGTVTVTVTAVNDAPVASSSSVTLAATNEGSSGISSNSSAIQFSGTSGYLATTISPLSNATNFTISFWVNPGKLAGYQSLVGQNDAVEVSLSGATLYVWTPTLGGKFF